MVKSMIQTKRNLNQKRNSTTTRATLTTKTKDRDMIKVNLHMVVSTNNKSQVMCHSTEEQMQVWLQLLLQVNHMDKDKPIWVLHNTCLNSNNTLQTNHNNFTSHNQANSINLNKTSMFLSNSNIHQTLVVCNSILRLKINLSSREVYNNNNNSNNRNPWVK